jgi:hypothetical protein
MKKKKRKNKVILNVKFLFNWIQYKIKIDFIN